MLLVIKDNDWFSDQCGLDGVRALRFRKTKFYDLMQIYTDLMTKQIPWEKVKPLGCRR